MLAAFFDRRKLDPHKIIKVPLGTGSNIDAVDAVGNTTSGLAVA